MPEYLHECLNCCQEFEMIYSIHSPIPEKCPLCGIEGKVKRLISGMPSVKMKLEGRELKEHVKEESKKNLKRFKTDSNFAANIIGEDKYEEKIKFTEKMNDRYKDI